jgi:hypothetical protein
MTVAYIYFLNKISLYFGGHAGLNKGIKEIRPQYSISAECGERSFVKNGRKERERESIPEEWRHATGEAGCHL